MVLGHDRGQVIPLFLFWKTVTPLEGLLHGASEN